MELPIYYATLTGQTTHVAQVISNYIQCRLPITAPTKDVDEHTPDHLASYSIFGCSTYGTGDPNPAAELFLEKLAKDNLSLDGLSVALFGLGESIYPDFCGSVDVAEKTFRALGAVIIQPTLKLDMLCSGNEINEQIKRWVDTITPKLRHA